MRIGIGLPAAVPGTPAAMVGDWAAAAERRGFSSVSVIDRLVYDNLDPLIALAAAAERTERIALLTTVLNIGYRTNPVLLAKQLASVELLSGGRLTTGLGFGGWPEDHEASGVPATGRGAAVDATIATLRRVWAGELAAYSGPMPALPAGRPEILVAGLVPAAFERAAAVGTGWVAPSFGQQLLTDGISAVRRAWESAGRTGEPRFVAERYFCLGPDADQVARHYLEHYYGVDGSEFALADAATDSAGLRSVIARLADAGCDDLVLLPCSGDLDQLHGLADILDIETAAGASGYEYAASQVRSAESGR